MKTTKKAARTLNLGIYSNASAIKLARAASYSEENEVLAAAMRTLRHFGFDLGSATVAISNICDMARLERQAMTRGR